MGKKHWYALLLIVSITGGIASCEKLMTKPPADDSVLDGPVEGLTPEQLTQFLKGDVAFNDEVFTSATGLGPLFVATSCGTCHARDGKGHPFTTLTRFGQTDSTGNKFLHAGGPQLQDRAIYTYQPEQIPAGATFSKFTPPANTGLGFLDNVTDASLMALADPEDVNGDGVSGRPNWIKIPDYLSERTNSIVNNGKYIGRFGKKAAAYDLFHQTVNAYNQDMGIASSYEAHDTYNGQEIDPEVSNQTVIDVVAYLKTLKAPIQRTSSDPAVVSGQKIFTSIGCGKCHTPELHTGYSSISALSDKTFFPYSDLLLHDMGPKLDDGYTEGSAHTNEWRTPPLWGLGLSRNSQGSNYFLMHDGRARSIEDAILLHGGEGQQSNNKFQQLSAPDKATLIKFLESL
ncbi:di-heme oxidoredictase family protein [Paraflavitalea sp. CAU 1676]|uniref:di-heme oxidoredictase family protein n=1 Tax=Paraflavitalea sp. CAU 1676 TaxID=3032598 RepID=UPI0023DC443E|nr:di-heme oxidoredictase family protein [Paraflavitalea sp. CAU 1676]MDF2191352.1 di-heme oxidoredictase family protein [Paraflavitalea sp. CAU 1676]